MSEGGSQRYDPRKKERRTPTAFSSKSLHQSRNGGFSRHRPSHAESKHVSQRSSEGKRSQVLTPRQDDMRQKNEPAARSRPENPGGNRQRSRSPRRGTRDTKFPEEPYSSRDARSNEMRTTRPHVDEVPRDNRGRQTWKDHPKSSRDISPARTSPPSRTTSTHRQQRPADSQPMRSASTHQQRAPVNQPARSASHHHQPSSRSPVDQPSRSAVSDMHHSSSDGQFRDNPPSSGRSASVPESRHGVTSHRDDSRPSLRDMQPEHGEQAKRIPSQREVTRYREEDSPPRDIYSERQNEARYTSPIVLPGQGQRYESRVMDKYSDPGQQRDKYSDPGQQRDLSPDYRNSSNVPMSRESFAPKTTLDARFGGTGRRFALEDNITIGIMRSSQLPPDEPMNIRYAFNPDTFQMIHLRRDRTKPIFAREEILQFNHDANLDDDPDFQERRVIKVTPAAGQRTRLFPVQLEDDGEFRQPIKPEQVVNIRMSQDRGYDDRHGPTGRGSHQQNEQRAEISVQKQYMPEDKWMSPPTGGRGYEVERFDQRVQSNYDDQRQQRPLGREKKQPEIRCDVRPDARYEPLFKESNKMEKSPPKVRYNPNDLRHNLRRRRQEDDDGYSDRKASENKVQKYEGAKIPVVQNTNRGMKDSGGENRNKGTNLPDFSNRADKYMYEEWKDKPEMIPTSGNYFEHDNRSSGFSDRGGFRGRGRGFRGRGFAGDRRGSNFGTSGAWKHDMYSKFDK